MASVVYSAILVGLNLTNGVISKMQNDKENHKMESDYENSLIEKLFTMGFINFYFPLFLVAFLKFFSYTDLFILVITQLGLKQVALNVIEYFMPVFFTQSKLSELGDRFQDVINKDISQFNKSHIPKTVARLSKMKSLVGERANLVGCSVANLSKNSLKSIKKIPSVLPHPVADIDRT